MRKTNSAPSSLADAIANLRGFSDARAFYAEKRKRRLVRREVANRAHLVAMGFIKPRKES